MNNKPLQKNSELGSVSIFSCLYLFLARRAYSVIIFMALFCTLTVKLFHSNRMGLLGDYFSWIAADVAVLISVEIIFAVLCFLFPRKRLILTVTIIAAVICTWSVVNASWLVRTGTQVLPQVLWPLVRDPANSFTIIGVNLAKMPIAAFAILVPSAIALAFFFSVLANPKLPEYNRRNFMSRIAICVAVVVIASMARFTACKVGSSQPVMAGLNYNCQLRAVTNFFSRSDRLARAEIENAKRKIPSADQLRISLIEPNSPAANYNVVIVVLEGVQYRYTSLADKQAELTPYLASLAGQGVEFTNMRSSLTHTTKTLFSILTGRTPSGSQDLTEAVPASKPYASLATILKDKLDFRTAFFQSAKGNFECRPGLVSNLGFDKFWAREDLNDSNAFVGYLGCDEFAMLKPLAEWLNSDSKNFLLTLMLSVTHDPYEVPEWFGESAKEPSARYEQTIFYTDKFIAALDNMLSELNLSDNTIFCVVGDHGEAFGEHSFLGHERIVFDEVLRIPFCLRAPGLITPGLKISQPTSSIDVVPTLLGLLGFDTKSAGFDGANAISNLPLGRKVYFSGWMRQSPAGFVLGDQKFIYNPANKNVSAYNMAVDPLELVQLELDQSEAEKITADIIDWRRSSIFKPNQKTSGKITLFENWLCRWSNRICSAKYRPVNKN
ncbi:MAG: sulfatase-like hydrolase/transferase [Planctomycetes bacterium]|nr:sulfatase-like hydrolase/transferase [Planctomycetota bacterium]